MTVTLLASCLMTSVNKSLYGKKSSSSSSPALHSAAISGFVIHSTFPPQQPLRSKRRQVKNACTHCQKACKKCDDARPCLRCVKYGISEECVDSQRKERSKGLKRGPYKKRVRKGVFPVPHRCMLLPTISNLSFDGAGTSVNHIDVPPQDADSVALSDHRLIPEQHIYVPGWWQSSPLALMPGVQGDGTQAYGTHVLYHPHFFDIVYPNFEAFQ